MSRLYSKNNRGRQSLLASVPRFSKSKEHHHNESYSQPGDKKRKPPKRYATTIKQVKRRRIAASTASATSSDSDADDDASEEEDESDAEDPEVIAPSQKHFAVEAGRKRKRRMFDEISLAGSAASIVENYEDLYEEGEDPGLSPEENRKLFETKVFADSDDDNDDDAYMAVDDISDSENELDLDTFEEQQLIASFSEEEIEEEDLYLNQIDGLSAYGFGDESDASVHLARSLHESDTSPDLTAEQRRVHFDFGNATTYNMRFSESPTIARALLPSALPDSIGVYGGPAAVPRESGLLPVHDSHSEIDDDLTDDDLPEEALLTQGTSPHQQKDEEEEQKIIESPSPSPKRPAKKAGARRGPPRGIFIDEGSKASGILDKSGKVILITHPHLLGDEFAKRYGASQTSSPDMGLEDIMDDSEAGDASSQQGPDMVGVPNADIMLASLNSTTNDSAYLGQAIGPLEAFFPANGVALADYNFDPNELDIDFEPDLGEDVMNINDMIKFDDDAANDSDASTPPIFMPPTRSTTGVIDMNNEYAHITGENVTAFKRNADPKYASFCNRPAFPDFSLSAFSTPNNRPKRKAQESPYDSAHYKGVTPVQRMRDPASLRTPESGPSSKRRKLTT